MREVDSIINDFKEAEKTTLFSSVDVSVFKSEVLPLLESEDKEEVVNVWSYLAGNPSLGMNITDGGEVVLTTPGLFNTSAALNGDGDKGLTDTITGAERPNNQRAKVKLKNNLHDISKNMKNDAWDKFLGDFEEKFGDTETRKTEKTGNFGIDFEEEKSNDCKYDI